MDVKDNFIKIPKDFKSVHDLKDLVANYGLATKLLNALNDYQNAYVNSFLMNLDEVLAYIPESKYKEYKVTHRANQIEIDSNRNHKFETILKKQAKKDHKMFLVNSIDKTVDVCYWGSKETCNVKSIGYFRNEKYNYNPFPSFDVQEKKNKLIVKITYSYPSQKRIGGVMINAGTSRAYSSGGKLVDCTDYDSEIYTFCTRTNRYLGCTTKNNKEYYFFDRE